MRKLTPTLIALTTGLGTLLHAQPAHADAFYSQGVKNIDYVETTDSCEAGQALPCTPLAGEGDANVLRVTQSVGEDGRLHFDTLETTADDPDNLWMAASIGAECRAGYHLKSAGIGSGYFWDTYSGNDPAEVLPWPGIPISVPNAKTMPAKTVALNIPLTVAFGETDEYGMSHLSMSDDFGSLEEIFAHGEQIIAQRKAAGQTEAVARSTGFTFNTHLSTHADVACEGNAFGRVFGKRLPRWLPLTIEFVGRATPPIKHPSGRDLTDHATVTDVELLVIPGVDPCTIHLEGWITANGDTDVTYRFIDEYGQLSNGFEIEVEANEATHVSHDVQLDPSDGEISGPAFAPEHGTLGGPADDYAAEDSPYENGTFQLRVDSPNLVLSDVEGWTAAPCVIDPVVDVDLPDVDEAGEHREDPNQAEPAPLTFEATTRLRFG